MNKKWYRILNENKILPLNPFDCECALVQKYHKSSQKKLSPINRKKNSTQKPWAMLNIFHIVSDVEKTEEKNQTRKRTKINGQPKVLSLLFYGCVSDGSYLFGALLFFFSRFRLFDRNNRDWIGGK